MRAWRFELRRRHVHVRGQWAPGECLCLATRRLFPRAPAQSPRRPNHYDRYDREGDRMFETHWNDEADYYHSQYYRYAYGQTAAKQPLDDYDYSDLWLPSYVSRSPMGPDDGPYGGYPYADAYKGYSYADLSPSGYSRPTGSFYEYPRLYSQVRRGFTEYPVRTAPRCAPGPGAVLQ